MSNINLTITVKKNKHTKQTNRNIKTTKKKGRKQMDSAFGYVKTHHCSEYIHDTDTIFLCRRNLGGWYKVLARKGSLSPNRSASRQVAVSAEGL
jgi:hypothetical protein